MRLLNPLVILRIWSTILFIEAASFLLCLPAAHLSNESPYPFLWSSLIAIVLSVTFFIVTRKVSFESIQNREGYLAVASSWILFSALGTLPYIISGAIPSFIDAFFEASSGFTTTGSSILKDVEAVPISILFYRSFTHWIGGLGIIVLVVIILPSVKITGFQLLTLESSLKEKIHPRSKAIVLRLLFIYVGLTVTEVVVLSLGDMNLFDSICHSFGTVATGGFSTKNTSIAYYSSYSQYVIAIAMFLSGISYVVYYHLFKLNLRKVWQNEELWFYMLTVLIAGSIVTSILLVNTTWSPGQSVRNGFFQVISFITTTGYTTTDYLLWPQSGLLVMFLLLFTGASTGSSAGGIKMARHLMVIKNIKNVLIRIIHQNMVSQIKLNSKPVTDNANISVLSFVVLFLFIFLIGTALLVLTGIDLITASSASISSLSNVGPGFGAIGPMSNYSHFADSSKLICSMLMIVGRLEIYTVFILFSRSYWKV